MRDRTAHCFEAAIFAAAALRVALRSTHPGHTDTCRRAACGVEGIRRLTPARLERLIRPSGYFRQKAKRLKVFVAFLDKQYAGSLDQLFSQRTSTLREELLSLNGVGPETADSMLLYAGNHPVFVVDAYTRRILERHEILPDNAEYDDIRELFQRALEPVVEDQQEQQPSSHSEARLEAGIRLPADTWGALSDVAGTLGVDMKAFPVLPD